MQTLGEKLAEARMKKGLSIQEASEQTKIRACFLEAFEQNNFDLDLPDIYKKGFVKNYADLVGLDPDGTAKEYSSGSSGTARSGRRQESRENFGQVDLGRAEVGASTDQPAAVTAPTVDKPSSTASTSRTESQGFRKLSEPRRSSAKNDSESKGGDRMLVTAVGVSIAAVALVVVFLVWMFKDDKSAGGEIADNNPAKAQNANLGDKGPTGNPAPAAPAPQVESMGLEAVGGDVKVILIDKATGNKIFDRVIKAGEAITIPKTGPLTILFDDGDRVYVRLKGKLFKMPKGGTGRSLIP